MKHLGIVVIVAAFLLSAAPALAHPPDSLALSFDDSTKTLSVAAHHPVKNPTGEHYVARITIALQGATIIDQQFKSQSDATWQNVAYTVIDAKPGDKVTITAFCSLLGKLKQEIELPAQ